MKHHLGISKAALLVLALTAAGCGIQGGTPATPGGAPLSSLTRQGATPLGQAAPLGHRNPLAGKYTGSVDSTNGNTDLTGTLDTTLHFNNKNIRGPFRITLNGVTTKCRIYGRVKSKTSEESLIVFAIYNLDGGYVVGNGSIKNGTLFGKAKSPPGAVHNVTVQFTANKT